MASSGQWPLIKGKARRWPTPHRITLQCHYCLGLFESQNKRRCYCSPTCQRAMHNESRRKDRLEDKRCPICLRTFSPRQESQRWCSGECRKLAWHRKKQGQPVEQLTNTTTGPDQAQQQAKRLRKRRHERDEQNNPLPLTPKNAMVISPGTPLPDSTVRQIAEVLAHKTRHE